MKFRSLYTFCAPHSVCEIAKVELTQKPNAFKFFVLSSKGEGARGLKIIKGGGAKKFVTGLGLWLRSGLGLVGLLAE